MDVLVTHRSIAGTLWCKQNSSFKQQNI